MAEKTFTNLINPVEVSLAIQRLLVADFGSGNYEPTSGRIDLDTLPTGFVDLGAVVEDTPTFSVTRTKFQLDAGLPAVRQFEAVIGLEGSFEISLHSNSWRKAQYAFGNYSAVSSVTQITTIASVTAQNVVTFANTSSVESLVLGLQFVIAPLVAEFDKADAVETRVVSITSDGLTFLLDPTPLNTIVAGDFTGYYDFQQIFHGTTAIRQSELLGVADFIDGSQVVHQFFKVTPGDEFTEEIRPTENERIPLSFNAFGVSRSDVPGAGGKSQLVIARRIYFPATELC